MKKILFILILACVSVSAFSQVATFPPVDGFWGLKFGSTQGEIIEGLKKKLGKDVKIIEIDQNILVLDTEFGKVFFNTALLAFQNGKLHSGLFTAKTATGEEAIEKMDKLYGPLSKKYGLGEVSSTDDVREYRWTDNAGNPQIQAEMRFRGEDCGILLLYSNRKAEDGDIYIPPTPKSDKVIAPRYRK